jgi:hypothetical protein
VRSGEREGNGRKALRGTLAALDLVFELLLSFAEILLALGLAHRHCALAPNVLEHVLCRRALLLSIEVVLAQALDSGVELVLLSWGE